MLVCKGCITRLTSPMAKVQKELGRCEVCYDRQLCSRVVVGAK